MLEEVEHNIDLSDGKDSGPPGCEDSCDLKVEISDALIEKERVKFTIRTYTRLLQRFTKPELCVVRTHEEFVWLADSLGENREYAGLIIPPVPPSPDFASSRDKLARLSDGELSLTKEEYEKMKSELEAEYLATFKKTVAMHEVFLRRIADHPRLCDDEVFKVFLEYDGDLNIRGRNKKELVQGFIKSGWKSVDDAILSAQKEKVEYFESQRKFITLHYCQLRAAAHDADRMDHYHKSTADSYIRVYSALLDLQAIERNKKIAAFLRQFGDFCEKYRKLESRSASDSDLKLANTLHYYVSDCSCAKDLMYRRSRAMANYENACKELEKARVKSKGVQQAEIEQEEAYNHFNEISESAKHEISEFKERWVVYFGKLLNEHTDLQIKHTKHQIQILQSSLDKLRLL